MSLLNRRPAPATARVLVASGRRLDLTPTAGKRKTAGVQGWQEDAWAYRDSIGEIRYAMGYLKHACSQVRLTVALAQADGEEPVPLDQVEGVPGMPAELPATAAAELARLTSGTFNYANLLAPLAENFEVPGECYLVGRDDALEGEQWGVYSTDELKLTDQGWVLLDHEGDKTGTALPAETSYVARLWTPHPRWHSKADSPMRALLDACEELQVTSRMVRAATRSRIASAGVLALPTEIDFTGTADPEDPDGAEGDPFMTALTTAMTTAISDEGDPSALVPIVIRAPAEALAALKHVSFAQNVDPKLLERIDKALARIGTGLDVPPEIITGVSGVNHWGAWQIDDATFRHHIKPLVVRMVDALTSGYLRQALVAAGIPEEWARRTIVWFDASQLVVKANRSDDAKAGHASLVISDAVLVESLGFNPETDMPDDAERERRIGDAIALKGSAFGAPAGETTTPQADTGQPDAVTAAAAPQGPVLRAHTRDSRRLAAADRTLRDQLTTAGDAAVTRAIERASNRVRSQARKDADADAIAASSAPRRAAAALGPALVASLGLDPDALLASAWEDLRAQWDTMTATARDAAVAAVASMAGLILEQLAAAIEALTGNAETAWGWFTAALGAEVLAELYDPDEPDQPRTTNDAETGEDPTRAGRIATPARGAVAITAGLPTSSPGITAVGLPAEPGVPLPTLATGDALGSVLRDAGQTVLAYEWVSGISQNHFQPHRDLDGVVFADFDSPLLANPGSWPAANLAPGDHKGCHCDATPVWADGPGSADLQAAGDATYDPAYLNVLRELAADDEARHRYGLPSTTPIDVVAQADRAANARPSQNRS